MSDDGTFLVEDFLEALTSQLDRTQDALRLKALNRPLTYAIRDFALDLRVGVEMDDMGQVRFRSAGPDDTSSSTVSIAFTTITRPMIEENTVALSEVQGPSLGDLGFAPEDQRSLEKLGVRNATQLKRLTSSSGEGAVSRFANVPVSRLRAALQASRPQVHRVSAIGNGAGNGNDADTGAAAPGNEARRSEEVVAVPPGTRRLRLDGTNLRDLRSGGGARLGGVPVPIVAAEDDHVVVDLGHLEPEGRLEIDVDGPGTLAFLLGADPGLAGPGLVANPANSAQSSGPGPAGGPDHLHDDPWSPS
jgi:hypothetical protein